LAGTVGACFQHGVDAVGDNLRGEASSLRRRERITDQALDCRQCLSEASYVILNEGRQQLHEDHSADGAGVFWTDWWQLPKRFSLLSAAESLRLIRQRYDKRPILGDAVANYHGRNRSGSGRPDRCSRGAHNPSIDDESTLLKGGSPNPRDGATPTKSSEFTNIDSMVQHSCYRRTHGE